MGPTQPSVPSQPSSTWPQPGSVPLNPIVPPPPAPPTTSDLRTMKSGGHKGLWIALILVFILVLSAGGFSVALAYEKVQINNPAIEKPLRQFVVGLPFMPKTPRFLIESAVAAQSKVTKDSFDASLAAQSDSFVTTLGLNQIDADIKGQVDYTSTANVKFNLTADITKDLNFEVRKNDTSLYLKVNKVPPLLWTLLKVDGSKVMPILANWIVFDTQPLKTNARTLLNQQTTSQSISLDQLLDQNLLSKFSVTSESVDSHPSYKLHLAADDQTVDSLIAKIGQQAAKNSGQTTNELQIRSTKPSQYLKNVVIDIWVDSSSYLVREFSTSFKAYPNIASTTTPAKVLGISTEDPAGKVLGADSSLYGLTNSPATVALVIKFDNFGQDFNVQVPSPVLKPEDFLKQVTAAVSVPQPASAAASPAFSNAIKK